MERNFFWPPLGHSEDLALHERGVLHVEEEAVNAPSHLRAGAEFGASQAKAARDVIARFGRHPHRHGLPAGVSARATQRLQVPAESLHDRLAPVW